MKQKFLLFALIFSSVLCSAQVSNTFAYDPTNVSPYSTDPTDIWYISGGGYNSAGQYLISNGANDTRYLTEKYILSGSQYIQFKLDVMLGKKCGQGSGGCEEVIPFPATCAVQMTVYFVKSSMNSASSVPTNSENLNNGDLPLIITLDASAFAINGNEWGANIEIPAELKNETDFRIFIEFDLINNNGICDLTSQKIVFRGMDVSGITNPCGVVFPCLSASDDIFTLSTFDTYCGHLWGDNIEFKLPSDKLGCQGSQFFSNFYVPDVNSTDPANSYFINKVTTGLDDVQNLTQNDLNWQQQVMTINTVPSPQTINVGEAWVILGSENTKVQVTVNSDGTFSATPYSTDNTKQPDLAWAVFKYTVSSGTETRTAYVYLFYANSSFPVNWGSFTAVRNKNTAVLNWETLTESNNVGFQVQRKNENGEFKTIGFVNSKSDNGNSSKKILYEFTDVNNESGLTQYRLMQQDKDGKLNSSAIRVIKGIGSQSKTIVYPNPTQSGNVSIQFSNTSEKNLQLYNVGGQALKQWNKFTQSRLDISNLNTGVYFLRIVDSKTGEMSTERIVVTR